LAEEEVDEANIFVCDSNYYALEVTNCLGSKDPGNLLWVAPVHNNTVEELKRFGEVFLKIAAGEHGQARQKILPS
jgi:selenocysteine lyase/cysteine desulfurase